MNAILIGSLEGFRTLIDKYGKDATILDVVTQMKKEEELEKMQNKIQEGC